VATLKRKFILNPNPIYSPKPPPPKKKPHLDKSVK